MVARSGYTARELQPAPTALLPDPLVLFFLLGLAARLLRSDLRVPEALYEALALYLLLAIGLKGGVELASHPLDGSPKNNRKRTKRCLDNSVYRW